MLEKLSADDNTESDIESNLSDDLDLNKSNLDSNLDDDTLN